MRLDSLGMKGTSIQVEFEFTSFSRVYSIISTMTLHVFPVLPDGRYACDCCMDTNLGATASTASSLHPVNVIRF